MYPKCAVRRERILWENLRSTKLKNKFAPFKTIITQLKRLQGET